MFDLPSLFDRDGYQPSAFYFKVVLNLMNADRLPIRAWSFANAFPAKWEVENFGSTKNEVAIEKITLSYTYSNRLI